jgi:hypothetical protein
VTPWLLNYTSLKKVMLPGVKNLINWRTSHWTIFQSPKGN